MGPFAHSGKATKATFVWERDRLAADAWSDDRPNPRSRLTVDVGDLLNVSAYKIGDYKKFFADPRTRAEYLQWAPMLIEAEDWCQRNQPKSAHKPRP